MLDDLDNMLESWESLFNSVLDEHCPSREKRVKRLQQVPWMSKPILDQVHLRDSYLKAARISGSSHDCKKSIQLRETKLSKSFVMLNVNILMMLSTLTGTILSQCGRQLSL